MIHRLYRNSRVVQASLWSPFGSATGACQSSTTTCVSSEDSERMDQLIPEYWIGSDKFCALITVRHRLDKNKKRNDVSIHIYLTSLHS
jgi:hypothetical protein